MKSHEARKQGKKKPQRTLQEKRQAKRARKSGVTLLGSHAPT
ncbi:MULTISPECIES: hypothetical protein [Pseudomonas]|uniref:Uncharacterized protein n=1 Tax=Pseudomonas flexibilis TaxID=706570 RepID=A0A1N6SFP2_9PSED|nr:MULTISPECIES: hypothetical protein [Pseudomonas]KHL69495.1 hypothetical protein SF06_15680 [Pseudomonas flexibilis]SCY39665.1 hypothetical protein SAMN02927929_02620 [Pseudomonas flexibilis]SIQ39973.1 hypothetical protein SAMN05421672_1066 [Pseudomonas flexibilis]